MRKRFPLICCFALSACAKPPTDIVEATGTLEVIQIDVSPTTPGRVSRVLVDEGAAVHAGDTLAILTMPTLASDVAQRQAAAAAAGAALQEAQHGSRSQEIESAAAELASAEANATHLKAEVERLRPLAASKMTSAQEFDGAVSAAATAASHRDALRAQLALLRAGTRPERVQAAEAEATGAKASVASALATAKDLVLVSPIAGTVMTRVAQPGEVIGAGQPALTVAQTSSQFVRVYVGEIVLPRVKVGQKVHATLDEFPNNDFQGRVVAISTQAEYTPRVALTKREREDLLFGVKVEFADTTGMLKAGLPITVKIDAPIPAPTTAAKP